MKMNDTPPFKLGARVMQKGNERFGTFEVTRCWFIEPSAYPHYWRVVAKGHHTEIGGPADSFYEVKETVKEDKP